MRKYILATAVVTALFGSAGYAAAQNVEIGPGGVRVNPGNHRYYEGRSAYNSRCRELRQACLHKGELGEQGEGNCRHYRETCGR